MRWRSGDSELFRSMKLKRRKEEEEEEEVKEEEQGRRRRERKRRLDRVDDGPRGQTKDGRTRAED